MDEILKLLLNALEMIGEQNEEIYDTEVREQLSNAAFDGFIRPINAFVLPDSYGLYTEEANRAVKKALDSFITAANEMAKRNGITAFHDRLAAFQNGDVESDIEGVFYDDFFGYSRPDAFDTQGKEIEVR